MLPTHALALSANNLFYARKSPYEYVHSVRVELAKMILVGTRLTIIPSQRGLLEAQNSCTSSIKSIQRRNAFKYKQYLGYWPSKYMKYKEYPE